MESSINSSENKMLLAIEQRKSFQGTRLQNPFTLKVGQVFTGFGIGCGIGIGVGRPINLGSIPMVGQVMSATRGATDAFSGVGRHVNGAVLKHHQMIEELMEENHKLHQILMEDLKIPPHKLQTSYSSKVKSPCSECFHYRRKQRKNRR